MRRRLLRCEEEDVLEMAGGHLSLEEHEIITIDDDV